MSKLTFKEPGHIRAWRLHLGKPHIYWGKRAGRWVASASIGSSIRLHQKACVYCKDQDRRWTPRQVIA